MPPHEITENHLAEIKKLFPGGIFYSQLTIDNSQRFNQLIIDNIGMLARLYHYAHITLVGGGYKPTGVHNVTEAAVYGKPVLMGPYISKYIEAIELVKTGGGIVINNADELNNIINELVQDKNKYYNSCEASFKYIRENAGAVNKILNYIQVNRLLTN